ncbi:MAG: L,D-transpeptidase [Halioglobus sp.]|nr:L,D-transpeptidase [Halioglobus sp.]
MSSHRMSFAQSPLQYCAFALALFLSSSVLVGVATIAPDARAAAATSDVWVDIDTEHLSLVVMEGKKPLHTFENIAIGSNGPTLARRRNDGTTPLGEFTITEIRPSERFKMFMAFNYPNLDHTERAFKDERISASEYMALRYNLDRGLPPSQSTSLGGQLGIHGLGRGDLKVHETVNWTEGCIALTNEQLAELAKWVVVGTRVVVR